MTLQTKDDEIARLRSELEAARANERRYLWLRDKWHGFDYLRTDYAKLLRLNIDEMCDAAIKAAGGE